MKYRSRSGARNWAFLPVAIGKSCEECPVWAATRSYLDGRMNVVTWTINCRSGNLMVPIAPRKLMVPVFEKVQLPKFFINCYASFKNNLGNLLVPKRAVINWLQFLEKCKHLESFVNRCRYLWTDLSFKNRETSITERRANISSDLPHGNLFS